VDNLHSVTYFSKVNDFNSFPTGVTVPNVLKRATTKTLKDGNKNITVSVAHFHIWANQSPVTPKANDKLTDADGVVWIVKEVEIGTLETRYKLTCMVAQ